MNEFNTSIHRDRDLLETIDVEQLIAKNINIHTYEGRCTNPLPEVHARRCNEKEIVMKGSMI
jgi:hypothetical protein